MSEKNNMKFHFTYKDGVRDGELNILDGKFDHKDVAVFLLIEKGYEPKQIAEALLMTENSVEETYALIRGYRNDIYRIKQKKALDRLMNAINKSR